MMPLLRITSISRPRSVLAVYSSSGAISTRACRVECFYGSRFRPKRTWSPKFPKQSCVVQTKKPLLLHWVVPPFYRGQCMSNGFQLLRTTATVWIVLQQKSFVLHKVNRVTPTFLMIAMHAQQLDVVVRVRPSQCNWIYMVNMWLNFL